MCSIIGYFGHDEAAPTLVHGLGRMEYRGYDSVGIATGTNNKLTIKKGVGKVSEVNTIMFTTKSGIAQCPISYGFILYVPSRPISSIAFPEPISEINNAGKTKETKLIKTTKSVNKNTIQDNFPRFAILEFSSSFFSLI